LFPLISTQELIEYLKDLGRHLKEEALIKFFPIDKTNVLQKTNTNAKNKHK